MKRKVTFLGIIAIMMIIGTLLTSCKGDEADASLEGEWVADGVMGLYSIVIGKDNFTQKIMGNELKLGDSVNISKDDMVVWKSNADVGSAKYSISSKKLTLSNPKGIFEVYSSAGITTWTKK